MDEMIKASTAVHSASDSYARSKPASNLMVLHASSAPSTLTNSNITGVPRAPAGFFSPADVPATEDTVSLFSASRALLV